MPSKSIKTNKLKKVDRPSPNISATKFPPGTRLKGNDGNFWEVVSTSNGVRRWLKVKDIKKIKEIKKRIEKTRVNLPNKVRQDEPTKKIIVPPKKKSGKKLSFKLSKKDQIKTPFQFKSVKTFRKIGEFDAPSGVVIGETSAENIGVMRGTYRCFVVDGQLSSDGENLPLSRNLMIVHDSLNMTKTDLFDCQFKDDGNIATVDYGTFGFFDKEIIEHVNDNNPNYVSNQGQLPIIIAFNKKDFLKGFIVSPKNIQTEYDVTFLNPKEKFGVYRANGVGTGMFPCYISPDKKMAVLVGLSRNI